MAEKFIKIIQDGRSSLIPDTPFNKAFWAKQNAKISGSQNASKEMVTIMPATEEEVAAMHVVVNPTDKKASQLPDYASLKKQIDDQQALINQLLLGKSASESDEDAPKGKPRPKPKI